MKRNLLKFMPVDQVRLCDGNNDYIEARGENARAIVFGVVTVLVAVAVYYLSRAFNKL